MKQTEVTVDYLANRPELAAVLARWSWEEWRVLYDARGRTFDDGLNSYQQRAQVDSLPLARIAFAGGEPIGTTSLMTQDLPIRPEITPWLASVFVLPEWRGRGVASLLARRAVDEAQRLHLRQLYLWTSSAEPLYLNARVASDRADGILRKADRHHAARRVSRAQTS